MDLLRPSSEKVTATATRLAQPLHMSKKNVSRLSDVNPKPPSCNSISSQQYHHVQPTSSGASSSRATTTIPQPPPPQRTELPAFLSRRSTTTTSAEANTKIVMTMDAGNNERDPPVSFETNATDFADEQQCEGTDEGEDQSDDSLEDDEANLLGDDDDLETHDDLMRVAEELSIQTGMSHAEVMELLAEQQRAKQARRMKQADKAKKQQRTTVRVSRRIELDTDAAAGGTNSGRREMFLTATPDLTAPVPHTELGQALTSIMQTTPLTAVVVAPPSPRSQLEGWSSSQPSTSVSRSVRRDHKSTGILVDAEKKKQREEEMELQRLEEQEALDNETPAERMRRQLDELFPDGLAGTSDSSKDDFVNLETFRKKRREEQNAKVLQHLQSQRGEVPRPKSLETNDVFVKAYELEMAKKAALKRLKEDTLARIREEQEKERKMKGIFSNLAIRKQIEEKSKSTVTMPPIQPQQRQPRPLVK